MRRPEIRRDTLEALRHPLEEVERYREQISALPTLGELRGRPFGIERPTRLIDINEDKEEEEEKKDRLSEPALNRSISVIRN